MIKNNIFLCFCLQDKMLMLAKESINFVFRHVTNPQQPTSD